MAVETPARPSLLNLPNLLTMSRLVLGAVLFVLIEWRLWIGCLIVFGLAVITDWLDGYFARKLDLVSPLGRMLDPLVDKIVVCSAFILLLTLDPGELYGGGARTGLAGWMVVVIVGREFLVTGVRSYMEHEGIPFGADLWGKLKMVLQCVVLINIFLLFAVESQFINKAGNLEEFASYIIMMYRFNSARDVLLWLMLIVTVGSGVNYCLKAARGLRAKGV